MLKTTPDVTVKRRSRKPILLFLLSFSLGIPQNQILSAKEADSAADIKPQSVSQITTSQVWQEPKTEAKVITTGPVGSTGLVSSIRPSDKKAIKEQINSLRKEKKDKFKQLTDGFIKKIITEQSVLSKDSFLKPGKRDLKECVQRAIDVHIPAKTSKERIKLAKQRIVRSLRDLLAEAVFETEVRHGSLSGQAFTGNSYHLRFKQPIFHGGYYWSNFRKEQATLNGAEAEYHQIVNDLIEKVSQAYFDTIRAERVMKDKQELLKQATSTLETSKKKWAQGLISEIEYLNVESMQSQIAHDVEQSRQDLALVGLELQKNLGLDLDEKIDPISYYDYSEVVSEAQTKFDQEKKEETIVSLDETELNKSLDKYLQMAYENRPDLRLEANRLRANIFAKKAALGTLLPQVDIVMEFGELAEAFTDIVPTHPDHKPEWQSILEVSWNIGGSTLKYTHDRDQNAPSVSQFQGGAGTRTSKNTFSAALLDNLEDVYKVREAEIEVMDQFVKLEQAERDMIRQVKEAYFNYRRAEIQLASEIKQLIYRERLAKVSLHRLELNEVQASEYLQAEIDLADKKAQFHKAMSDYYVARAGLNRAVGIQDLLPITKWKKSDYGK